MARQRGTREISIFNFSFLDILACTVGALAFTLVMVIVINVGSLPLDIVMRLEAMGEDLERTTAENEAWKVERDEYLDLQGRVNDLERDLGELEEAKADADVENARLSQRLAVAEDMLDAVAEGEMQDDAALRQADDLAGELAEVRSELTARDRRLAEQEAQNEELIRKLEEEKQGRKTKVPFWAWIAVVLVALMGVFLIWMFVAAWFHARKMRQTHRLVWVEKNQVS